MVNGLFLQPIAFMWKQFLILVVLVNYSRFKKNCTDIDVFWINL